MLCVFRQVRPLILLSGALTLAYGESLSLEKQAGKILEAKCLACHGQTRMADLDLRELSTTLKGGKRGPAVVPGNAEESLLYKAVKRDGELQMPPGKSGLSAAEVTTLKDWINAGARFASGTKTAEPSWWSLRKPVRPAIPGVKDASWIRNPIDAFIFAKLEAKGLRPAPAADRRTLARRVYFDLHGLPPTPEEVDQFVNDTSTDAYEKLIDASRIAALWRALGQVLARSGALCRHVRV